MHGGPNRSPFVVPVTVQRIHRPSHSSASNIALAVIAAGLFVQNPGFAIFRPIETRTLDRHAAYRPGDRRKLDLSSPGKPGMMAGQSSYFGGSAMTWNLADAKNRLSEVVNLALTEGPQIITRRQDVVVVVSAEMFAEMTGQRQDFKEFLMSGPSLEGLDLKRDKSPMRDIGL